MYDSIKPWLNIPVQIKPFIKRSGTGAKQLANPVGATCYVEGKAQTIKNKDGAEVVSNCQLYFDGSTPINVLDVIVHEGADCDIQAINTFYRDGVPDIKVVYL